MNEDLAWNEFEKTGKIEDYLKYINTKKSYNMEIGKIEGDISEVSQGKGYSN